MNELNAQKAEEERELDCNANTVENTTGRVASYTLAAMCEEDAIRAEEEIAETLELQEATKSKVSGTTTETKVTEMRAQKARARMTKVLENAKLDENGKMQIYILYEDCGNDCMAYLINTKNKKERIQSKFAYQLIEDGRAVKFDRPKSRNVLWQK